MSLIELRCDHAELNSGLSQWLGGALFRAPERVVLDVQVGEPAPLPASASPLFKQGRVRIRGGTSRNPEILMHWGPCLGSALIAPESRTATVIVSDAAQNVGHELYRSFFLNVCILLLRRVGLHHVHAATLVDHRGRGWMLAGPSGGGKSTTTALLAARGWGVGTDDIALLSRGEAGEVIAQSWREPVALRHDAVAHLARNDGEVFESRKKHGWLPEMLGSTWTPTVWPDVLAIVRVDRERPTHITPLTRAKAFEQLMLTSAWVMLDAQVADEHLALLEGLVSQCELLEVRLGPDFIANPDMILGRAS